VSGGTGWAKPSRSSVEIVVAWGGPHLRAARERKNQDMTQLLTRPTSGFGRFRWALPLLLIGILGSSTSGFADEFRLKDGRRLVGEIVREIGDLVSIKTTTGVVTVERSDIVKRVETRTPYEEYLDRVKELADNDSSGHLELARFCDQNELKAEAILHFKKVMQLSPNNEEARTKLGYLWLAGDWFLEGSPEIEAKRAELEETPTEDLIEMPDRFSIPKPSPAEERGLPPLPASAEMIHLVLDERIGRERPKVSGASHVVSKLCRSFSEPMRVTKSGDPEKCAFEIRVKVRCYFAKTVRFYNKPLYHVFTGEVQMQILERRADGSTRSVGRMKFKKNLSANVDHDKSKSINWSYHATIEELEKKLEDYSWFKKRL